MRVLSSIFDKKDTTMRVLSPTFGTDGHNEARATSHLGTDGHNEARAILRDADSVHNGDHPYVPGMSERDRTARTCASPKGYMCSVTRWLSDRSSCSHPKSGVTLRRVSYQIPHLWDPEAHTGLSPMGYSLSEPGDPALCTPSVQRWHPCYTPCCWSTQERGIVLVMKGCYTSLPVLGTMQGIPPPPPSPPPVSLLGMVFLVCLCCSQDLLFINFEQKVWFIPALPHALAQQWNGCYSRSRSSSFLMFNTETAVRPWGPPYWFIGTFCSKRWERCPKWCRTTRNHCSQRGENPCPWRLKPPFFSQNCSKWEKFTRELTPTNSETGLGTKAQGRLNLLF